MLYTGVSYTQMKRTLLFSVLTLTALLQPLRATVTIQSITPSLPSPQPLGTPINWMVVATDSNSGPLTFQFNSSLGSGPVILIKDFNVGVPSSGVWTAQPFSWATIQSEGAYRLIVVVKDFKSGESATESVEYTFTSLVSGGSSVVNPTANPLVAVYSAPACPAGSTMRVTFQRAGSGATPYLTDWKNCNSETSMNFYIAGMYPKTTYKMNYQLATGSTVSPGPTALSFTTGALPNVKFPAFTVPMPPGPGTDTAQLIDLHALVSFTNNQSISVATDLSGRILWYYQFPFQTGINTLTRPLSNESILSIQSGQAWQAVSPSQQLIRRIDLAGNIVQETNTGIIQNQLVKMGFTDAGPCTAISSPPPLGAACLGGFHHEAQLMPNGDYVIFADIEKIFPPGTQGDSSGLPVDIMGDIYIVLSSNFQVQWAWEAFQHAGGGTQLNINRPAVLGETCPMLGCPPIFLLGSGIAPKAHDWMHSNSAYYWPNNNDLVISIRDQDWVIKIDYRNGTGTGAVLWRMGPLDGDFVFNNINNDSWPWFSNQHDFGIENGGAGPATVFDNGNTRVSAAPLGLGCTPGTTGCNSRGMALTIDESNMTVTPVMSQDLGVYAGALGSAQLLSNGDYFFQPGQVDEVNGFGLEYIPIPQSVNGTLTDSLEGPSSYRSFRQADLYHPPTT
jgi:arylsulfate sulfotransferase